ncbi:hypothetical protein [Urbifossiella limnaea]|uniref:Uncharacterized protein n=1 Tax=Urbifossiella limnaea TaxID=2528023 RepID=A0A517XZ37_9BACT|nr:hypothetical protein [Urbifossiella limnaea]QDU22743.1 hypothetical protein ETAA1_47290 [Urbifossiella limnaea]
MNLNWGQEYRGPGEADPSKSRAERAAELGRLMRTAAGEEIVDYYFARYTGVLSGLAPPVGMPTIKTILDHEYPNEQV